MTWVAARSEHIPGDVLEVEHSVGPHFDPRVPLLGLSQLLLVFKVAENAFTGPHKILKLEDSGVVMRQIFFRIPRRRPTS